MLTATVSEGARRYRCQGRILRTAHKEAVKLVSAYMELNSKPHGGGRSGRWSELPHSNRPLRAADKKKPA